MDNNQEKPQFVKVKPNNADENMQKEDKDFKNLEIEANTLVDQFDSDVDEHEGEKADSNVEPNNAITTISLGAEETKSEKLEPKEFISTKSINIASKRIKKSQKPRKPKKEVIDKSKDK